SQPSELHHVASHSPNPRCLEVDRLKRPQGRDVMTEQPTRVVVISGGYARVIAANHLPLRPDGQITLVNPRPAFVERIRAHQLVPGSDDATVAYADILGDGIRLVIDAATRIDTEARQVELFGGFPDGRPLPYDYLIYAVGSSSAQPAVPGADEFGY